MPLPRRSATAAVVLEFDPVLDELRKTKQLRDGLSVAVQIGETFWVTNDETASVERLSCQPARRGAPARFADHTRFLLADYLRIPAPPEDPPDAVEADLEGIDYADGYLWLVGSHSRKRGQAVAGKSAKKNLKKLADVDTDPNRWLLARIPVVGVAEGAPTLARTADAGRTAAQLRGTTRTNDLLQALRADEHLAPFLAIPGKDNGFDIEGLAAVPEGRLLLGLRGPVLRGWAVVLEVAPEPRPDDPTTLRLRRLGADGRRYRKHFLVLGGLGVRDLCRDGDDVLVLAGPSMDLDGPATIFRWRGGAQAFEEAQVVSGAALEPIIELPVGRGDDHPEGIAVYRAPTGDEPRLVVVHDAAAPTRQVGASTVRADVVRLPARGPRAE
ncbi:MAG: DUF3616 domain-containing protein [Hymenobacteraceae bacterium]|nr:DUF3616 domain-containing protein [Hymenobacteraceae bacterium]